MLFTLGQPVQHGLNLALAKGVNQIGKRMFGRNLVQTVLFAVKPGLADGTRVGVFSMEISVPSNVGESILEGSGVEVFVSVGHAVGVISS